ncbi:MULTISPECIES: M23 family metallopeptidase [unclassified Streptomyces]|uniref:M23 family metallopeptidase n=1 Tax=unclassified Streptomyces TaxID=2593676 RepID=UPI000C277641|nr:M23 family metallopeptidase [Streptomyces sp. CB01201]MBX7473403.1 M23 family metallopeptidase [Streptomyces sp. MAG02]PJN00130.1 peptidase [Streptomyces sp. CB01201]
MPQRTLSKTVRPSAFRLRAAAIAAVAAGTGAATLLGAGAAAADSASLAPTSVTTSAVADQAKAQTKAAAAVKQAAAAKAASWVHPVSRYTLSASFGLGGSMWSHKHSGQDFAVPNGTPVLAAHAGTVVKAGPVGAGDGPAYGNAVVVRHANNTYSQYAHLSKINVRVGQSVGTGERIALSGNTGNSSGPHLHFEIRTSPNYGSAVNPVAFLRTVGVTV